MGIPIVIGVTGHRSLRSEDIPQLYKIITEELKKIICACPNSRIVMLNSLAEGADQLCAEAAIALGISLIVALPVIADEYRKDFSGEALAKFEGLCSAASEVFVAPHTELLREQTKDFYYRQAGIYIARHSHVLLALWSGSKASKDGCGTAEAVDFMLSANYTGYGNAHFKATDDGAVVQIITPKSDGAIPENAFSVRLIENREGSLKKALSDTDLFNKDLLMHVNTKSYPLVDVQVTDKLSAKSKTLHTLYQKADGLSIYFRDSYLKTMRVLSALGVGLVLSFLLYDEMESNLFLPVYGIILLVSAACLIRGKKGAYHKKYLEYRALAETIRVQFYLMAANVDHNIFDSFTWSQKNEIVWVKEAIAALLVGKTGKSACDIESIKSAWIDSQIEYHNGTHLKTGRKEHLHSSIASTVMMVSVAIFTVVTILEFFQSGIMTAVIPFDSVRKLLVIHEGQEIIVRGIFKILLGVFSAVALFLSNYYGKLSLSQKLSDHEKMARLYMLAQKKWDDPSTCKDKLLIDLAREEIIENGIWLSYCRGNAPSLNL